jgi:hypothetical protein
MNSDKNYLTGARIKRLISVREIIEVHLSCVGQPLDGQSKSTKRLRAVCSTNCLRFSVFRKPPLRRPQPLF